MMIPDFSDMTPHKPENRPETHKTEILIHRPVNHKRRINSVVHTRLQAQFECGKQEMLGMGTFRKRRL